MLRWRELREELLVSGGSEKYLFEILQKNVGNAVELKILFI